MVEVPFLSRFAFFANLGAADVERVAGHMFERQYPKGETIFHQGDPGESLYFLREGSVKVYRVGPDGREQIIRFFGKEESFGLVVAIDRQPYPSSAEAVENCRVWCLRVDDFMRLQRDIPALAPKALDALATRLRLAQDRAHTLAVRTLHSRLAQFLLEYARDRGQLTDGTWVISLGLTHEELGGLLGASRETVTRAMADLRKDGAIRSGSDGRVMLDAERITRWAEE